jgi:hypothetical protein
VMVMEVSVTNKRGFSDQIRRFGVPDALVFLAPCGCVMAGLLHPSLSLRDAKQAGVEWTVADENTPDLHI